MTQFRSQPAGPFLLLLPGPACRVCQKEKTCLLCLDNWPCPPKLIQISTMRIKYCVMIYCIIVSFIRGKSLFSYPYLDWQLSLRNAVVTGDVTWLKQPYVPSLLLWLLRCPRSLSETSSDHDLGFDWQLLHGTLLVSSQRWRAQMIMLAAMVIMQSTEMAIIKLGMLPRSSPVRTGTNCKGTFSARS